MQPRRRAMTAVAAVAAAVAFVLTGASEAWARNGDSQPNGTTTPSAMPAAGTFYPVDVERLMGTTSGGYAVAPANPVTVAATGRAGLPSSGVSAVVLNVTASGVTGDPGLFFSPSGSPTPADPLVTVPAGTSRSTLLTVPLATAGAFDVAATGGDATVIADLVGFYAADDTVVASHGISGGYQPVDPARVYESAGQPLTAGQRTVLAVDLGAAANPHTTALLLRVSATASAASGSLAVWRPGGAATDAVTFAAGSPSSNLAVVPVRADSDGSLDVGITNTSVGSTSVAIDVVGFYDDGALGPNLRFRPLPQSRVVDTRSGLGSGTLQPDQGATATTSTSIVGDSTFGLVGVVTATSVSAAALDIAADVTPSPTAGMVPVPAGTPTSTAVQTEVGAGRGIGLRALDATAPLDLTFDVVGSFEAYPPVGSSASRGWVPPVSRWQISASVR